MQNNNENTNNNNQNNQSAKMDLLKTLAKRYEGASEDEIISAIMLEAEKGRKRGTLSDKDVDNFANMLYPMLNPSQRKKLAEVVNRIKKSK